MYVFSDVEHNNSAVLISVKALGRCKTIYEKLVWVKEESSFRVVSVNISNLFVKESIFI